MDRFVDDRTLDDNVDSFFSHDAADPRDQVGQSGDGSKGTTDTTNINKQLLTPEGRGEEMDVSVFLWSNVN